MTIIEIDINGKYQRNEFAKTIQIKPEFGVSDELAIRTALEPFLLACVLGDCKDVVVTEPRIINRTNLIDALGEAGGRTAPQIIEDFFSRYSPESS